MDFALIAALVMLLVTSSVALVFRRRVAQAKRRIAELEADLQNKPIQARPTDGSSPRPADIEPESVPAAREPSPDPNDPTRRYAARMVREAHEMIRYLSLEARPDLQQPTVYRVTLDLQTPPDIQAARYVEKHPFDCVHGISIHENNAVLLIDSKKSPPA
jgi:hypothetical protein